MDKMAKCANRIGVKICELTCSLWIVLNSSLAVSLSSVFYKPTGTSQLSNASKGTVGNNFTKTSLSKNVSYSFNCMWYWGASGGPPNQILPRALWNLGSALFPPQTVTKDEQSDCSPRAHMKATPNARVSERNVKRRRRKARALPWRASRADHELITKMIFFKILNKAWIYTAFIYCREICERARSVKANHLSGEFKGKRLKVLLEGKRRAEGREAKFFPWKVCASFHFLGGVTVSCCSSSSSMEWEKQDGERLPCSTIYRASIQLK